MFDSALDTLYRHGDVLVRRVAKLPSGAIALSGHTLAQGEVTGHSHRIEQPEQVQLWQQGNQTFLEIKSPIARLIHEEHHAIELPQGIYQFWKQREYRPDRYVDVSD